MNRSEIGRREAWVSAVWSSAMDAGVGVLGALVFRARAWLPLWAMVQFAAVGALLLIVLLAWRRARRSVCLVFFSLNVASALLTSLVSANAFVHAGLMGQLFQSVKLGVVVIAILSPSVRLGLAWIAIFAAAPVVQVYTWSADIRAFVPVSEPWFVPIYAVVAAVLLVFRRRGLRLERALANAQAERNTVERLARVSLALRDLANTPLQTLTTGVTLLRHQAVKQDQVLESMDRALERLQILKHALVPFEQHIEWQPHEESFDAITRIEQMAADLGSRPER